ncbi:sugar phosphate isomerase/epimerase family protein [Paenibacillus woosongensis]|uniref:TIM barrel protein n=1 Tax=Paenibacillus woosongensis TaxID=307580 RepID=A0A7X3CNL1_9BACL|nr:sugar phosphate isomerase/epimerase [Paenibacillus woosongensis]MUG45282.1 TIM barrel protein [Paenibacillus woosongensis]
MSVLNLGIAIHCLWGLEFKKIAEWCSKQNVRLLEVSCMPSITQNDVILGNFNNLTILQKVDEIKEILDRYNLGISTLTCNLNNLDRNFKKRNKKYLYNTIDLAKQLGVRNVGTYVGYDESQQEQDSICEFHRDMQDIYEYSAENKIKILIENCPGIYSNRITNLGAHSRLWDLLLEGSPVIGITLDLSHCITMGDNYLDLIRKYGKYIHNVHAKDKTKGTELNDYSLPGEGDVDWRRVWEVLQEQQYTGVIVIENESKQWTKSEQAAFAGLLKAKRYLERIVTDGN